MKPLAGCAALLLVAPLHGCTASDRSKPPPAPSATPPPPSSAAAVYAFEDLTDDSATGRVRLVRDGSVVAAMPGEHPALTRSGRYLVTSAGEKIFVMDVSSGTWQQHTLGFLPPIDCAVSQSLVGDSILLLAPTLERRSLPDLAAVTPVPATLPRRRPGCVIGSARGDPIVLVSSHNGHSARTLYRVGPGGTTRRLGPDPLEPPDDGGQMGAVRLSITDPPRAAYVLREYVSDREDSELVETAHVLDLDSGRDTIPAAAGLKSLGPAEDLDVLDLWWSSAGALYATIDSDAFDRRPGGASLHLWRVTDGSWKPVNHADWDQVRELPDGRRLVTIPATEDHPNRLYEEGPGGRRLIADDIGELATVPVPVRNPPEMTETLPPRG